jgi:hypothetical protein
MPSDDAFRSERGEPNAGWNATPAARGQPVSAVQNRDYFLAFLAVFFADFFADFLADFFADFLAFFAVFLPAFFVAMMRFSFENQR